MKVQQAPASGYDAPLTLLLFADSVEGASNPTYDAILEIADDGGWTWKTIEAGKIIEEWPHAT